MSDDFRGAGGTLLTVLSYSETTYSFYSQFTIVSEFQFTNFYYSGRKIMHNIH